MSNEWQIRLGVNCRDPNSNFVYPGVGPQAFFISQETTTPFGPYPGAIAISISGTDIDLSKFSRPGLVDMYNPELVTSGKYVEYGIYDPALLVFRPLGEVGPSERYLWKLSRNIGEEWSLIPTGTGTGPVNKTLRFKAYGGTVNMFIGIFER